MDRVENAGIRRKSGREARRLAALHSLCLLGSDSNATLNGMVKAAAGLFSAPMAFVSFVDNDKLWIKASFDPQELLPVGNATSRANSFCNRTIRNEQITLVADALSEAEFEANPLVRQKPNVKFYVGAPLKTPDGSSIGTLCVMDVSSKDASTEAQDALVQLSTVVMDLLIAESESREQAVLGDAVEPLNAEQRILHTACVLLADCGASDFSVRKVARASGISLGHLQHYFKDKQTLLLSVLDSIEVYFSRYLKEYVEVTSDPNDRIIQYGLFVMDHSRELYLYQLLREYWAMSSRDEAIARSLESFNETMIQFLASAIREANDDYSQLMAESKAAVSLALLSGVFLFQGHSEERDYRIRQSVLESLLVLPSCAT